MDTPERTIPSILPEPERVGPAAGGVSSSTPAVRRGRGRALCVGTGLLAALAAWGIGEWAVWAFAPRYEVSTDLDAGAKGLEIGRQKEESLRRTVHAGYGALGGLLGLTLGLCGGSLRGSGPRAAGAGAVGLAIGAGVVIAACEILLPSYHRAYEASSNHLADDVVTPLLIHGGFWIGAGVAGGLAMGIGLGGWRCAFSGAVGGAIGVVLGTLAYEIAGGIALPMGGTATPLASTPTGRLLAFLAVALGASAGASWAALAPPANDRAASPA